MLLDRGLALVVISCVCSGSDLQNCDLLWANHVLQQGLFSAGFASIHDSTVFVAKIICGEAHHYDVCSLLESVPYCSDAK